MFIVVLLLSVCILWGNLKSYKTLFVPNKYLAQEAREKMKQLGDGHQGLLIFISIIVVILPIAFYSIAANVFISNKILLGYAVLQIILTLISLRKVISFVADVEKDISNGVVVRLMTPFNTVFIGYFIYSYVMSL